MSLSLSNRFTCVGHRWRLILYAGGAHYAEQWMVSVELVHRSGKHIKITLEFSFDYSIMYVGNFNFIPYGGTASLTILQSAQRS